LDGRSRRTAAEIPLPKIDAALIASAGGLMAVLILGGPWRGEQRAQALHLGADDFSRARSGR
jgi:hypothetical protein